MKKEKKWTLSTKEGCRKMLAVCLITILAFSFLARVFATDFGKVKNEQITIDVRGAQMNAELYYPVGTSSEDSLPAVVVTHGGGVNNGCMKPLALELARRDFVVMNISFYGAGLSEMALIDDGGQGEAGYNESVTPGGQIDALNYLRTLEFVDATRIGLAGHSAGGVRARATLAFEGEYYSLNDILINILYEQFNQVFTEDEINEDAMVLAKERLNADQYALFEVLAEIETEDYNTRVKTVAPIGSITHYDPAIVNVAGYEVSRTLKVNIFDITGTYQGKSTVRMSDEAFMSSLYINDPIAQNHYYALDDLTGTSEMLGDLNTRNDALTTAADNRALRGFCFAKETHSQNFFSVDTTANIINVMETTLSNESGMDPHNQIWVWRVVCTTIAMFAMLAMVFPLLGLLLKTEFFASCIGTPDESRMPKFSKKLYWIVAVLMIFWTYFATRKGTQGGPFATILPQYFNAYFVSQNQARIFMHWVALGAAVSLIVFALLNKKKHGTTGLYAVNSGISVKSIFKCILLGIIYICIAYATLVFIWLVFHEDYRLWNTSFSIANVEDLFSVFPYWLNLFILYIVIGASTNYTVRKDIPEWLDTLITVLINSAGVYILFVMSRIYNATMFIDTQWSDWDGAGYGLLLLVPVTTYITRKMYNITKNVWAGATVNACLVAWLFAGSGYNSILYHGQNVISNFFGL